MSYKHCIIWFKPAKVAKVIMPNVQSDEMVPRKT